MQDRNFLVYALLEIADEKRYVRYIGKTSREPNTRLSQHISEAWRINRKHFRLSLCCNCLKCEWLRTLPLPTRDNVCIEPLEWNLTEGESGLMEALLIHELVKIGVPLVNSDKKLEYEKRRLRQQSEVDLEGLIAEYNTQEQVIRVVLNSNH